MPGKDFLIFSLLKEDLVRKLQETYPEIGNDISAWKGKEILFFQKDLEAHVKGRISEKSFYTHFKSDTDKLPRIDVLDLLCRYAGHESWMDFIRIHQRKSRSNKVIWIVTSAIVVIICAIVLSILFKPKTYSISVIDAYSKKHIHSDQLKVTQLFVDQSPKEIDGIDDSIFNFYTNNSEIKFIIKAPYFHDDTIVRKVNLFSAHENIKIFPNDYALIIHAVSKSENDDWVRRRAQLSNIISDNARIFQINSTEEVAVEMYNKHEFINKLTLPVSSLKNIDIIDIKYENDLISELRFTQEKGGLDD